ncbi:DUF5018 domain-containing protein [Ichthyobacterium seriolicida]|uniref:Pkd domain containing protein n=1 Tax=Ichthyobacterium seriolicida TaxID=242600 RepID=A0A1J1DXW5_9FLAO|nr:hypothetical protein [Ichthyobacterium seriolicida]BAV94719.1 hypothetical protein JBKA6_0706 [Ichthyobacterium seriolicida]
MFKKNYFIKSIIFSFVLLSVIIFSCDKKNIIEDDLNICIESFALLDSENDQKNLGSDIKCDIDAENYTISLIVPSSAELRGLKFNITPCEGVSISPASGEETDFELVEKPSGEYTEEASEASSEGSSSKRYKKIFTLTKGEKSQDYTVYITKESAPKLTGFKISANESKGIKGEVTAVITDDTDTATGKILLKIPYTGTTINLVGLTSVINVPEGCTIDPANGSAISESIDNKEFSLTTALGSKRVYTAEAVKGPYISAFKFAAATSGRSSTNAGIIGEGVTGTIDHIAGTISVTVPSGVTLSNLTPTIEVGENTKTDFTPSAQANFGSNVEYRVTSSNPSAADFTKVYTVSVTQNVEPQIQSFTFSDSSNNGKNLGNNIGVEVKHTEGTIIVKVPHNADLTGLTPTITAVSGVKVCKGETCTTEDSDISNDFANSHDGSVKYSAVCPAGGRKVYSVKVYKEPAITGFSFTKAQNTDNSGFPTDQTYNGNISGNNITITVANTVNVANLKASIAGDNIAANYVTSGLNFTTSSSTLTIDVPNEHLQTYTKTYNVTVTKESAPVLSSFSINADSSKGIADNVQATFEHEEGSATGKILLRIPYKGAITLTGLTSIIDVPEGCSIDPTAGTITESIENKEFTLTKTDTGSQRVYTVEAVKGPYISAFKFPASNSGINADISATNINHDTGEITITVPSGVTLSNLIPTVEVGENTKSEYTPSAQADFGSNVEYRVTSSNPSATDFTKVYTVTVTQNAEPQIQSFTFSDTSNAGKNLGNDITGKIKGSDIIVKVPHDATLTALVPTVTPASDVTVYKGDTGSTTPSTTSTDFSSSHSTAVKYRAVCAAGGEKVYSVKVYKEPAITGFKFEKSANGSAGFPDTKNEYTSSSITQGAISESGTITITVANTVNVASLKASVTGDNIAENLVISDLNFSSGNTTVTVTNKDLSGFNKTYTVNLTKEAEPQIGSFTFTQSSNSGKNIVSTITGDINNNEIILKVSHNTDLTGLTPTVTAGAVPSGTKIYSGDTGTQDANTSSTDFTNSHTTPVKYSAVGPVGGRKVYFVKVYKEPALTGFKFEKSANTDTGFPDGKTYTGTVANNAIINITVANTVNVASLTPTITGSNLGSIFTPTALNFTTSGSSYSATITVKNEHLQTYTKQYTVNLTKEAAPQLTELKITADESKGIKDEVSAELTHPSDSSNTGTIKLKFSYNVANHSADIDLTGLSYTSVPSTGYTLTPASPLTGQSIHGQTFTLTKDATGSKSIYTVQAVKGPFIKSFKFTNSSNSGKNLGATDVNGTINHANNTIAITVPSTVARESSENKVTLTPTIELGGDGTPSISPNTGASQEFTSGIPVNYKVTGQDGMEKTYAVTVTRTKSTIAQIKTFAIGSNSGNITHPGSGNGDKGRIAVPVTSVPSSSVTPSITQSDYATVTPVDAQTFNSYDDSKEYTVTAEDTNVNKAYEVYIHDSTKVISDSNLEITDSSSAAISPTSKTIDQTTRVITVTVPSSTTDEQLKTLTLALTDSGTPSYTLTADPASGQDFSGGKEVKYTLTDTASGSTVVGHYWVKVQTGG